MGSSVLTELWDTTRMRLLVEIERRGSLSAAAREVGIGQPSASQHLRLLEAAAGQRLVERNGRGSRLTEAGRVLAGRAAQALATLGAADEDLAALAGLQTGTIHLGASTAPGVYLLPGTLGCFRRDYPGVTVEVEIAASADILRRLLGGRIQLALVGSERADERIVLDPFLEDEIVGIGKPGLLKLRRGALEPSLMGELTLLARDATPARGRSPTRSSRPPALSREASGSWLQRGDQTRRRRRSRSRVPLALRRNGRGRARRAGELPAGRPACDATAIFDRPPRGTAAFPG